jgi:hypothetical protein
MKTVHEYIRHAEECEALAKKTTSPDQREMISKMAETWRMLAEQRRQRIERKARDTG